VSGGATVSFDRQAARAFAEGERRWLATHPTMRVAPAVVADLLNHLEAALDALDHAEVTARRKYADDTKEET
jgi:hypothetical protein